jgi:hypothetical protein
METIAFHYTKWRLSLSVLFSLVILFSGIYWALAFTTDLIETPGTTRKAYLIPVVIVLGIYMVISSAQRLLQTGKAIIISKDGLTGHALKPHKKLLWSQIKKIQLTPFRKLKFWDASTAFRTIQIHLKGGETVDICYSWFGPKTYINLYKSLRRTSRELTS